MEPVLWGGGTDSDSDEEFQGVNPRRGGQQHHLPLANFLALIAGGGRLDQQLAAPTNDELVEKLRRSGMLSCDRLVHAMKMVPRDAFVPEGYRQEALLDAPIRVEEHDFNISAPHMHSAMVEALQLAPGHSVLDVGCGCGMVAALASILVGPRGHVVGIDVRRDAVEISKGNVRRLNETSHEYMESSCPIQFDVANVFLLGGTAHTAKYDRVHIGASCPRENLRPLMQLLKPEGGMMVVPVAPSDLMLITRRADGTTTQRIINQVRFSDLEVPGDAEVALAQLRAERRARLAFSCAPSTYEDDLAAIAASSRWKTEKVVADGLSTSPAGVLHGLPPSPAAAPPRGVESIELGPPDCTLQGEGWTMRVHSAVMKQRCSQLRARGDSGMRDAELSSVFVPGEFKKHSVETFLRYVYYDEADIHVGSAVGVCHVALYFGVPRLAQSCEAVLAKHLRSAQRSDADVEAAADASATLLVFADEHGLPHLLEVALDYMMQHYEVVEKTESFKALTKDQVALVARAASKQVKRSADVLKELRANSKDVVVTDGNNGGIL